MTTYTDHRDEALAFLRHARPTNTVEHLAAAQVNATLALAAATHDVTLREYTEPIALVPVEPQSGAGQPLADWERVLYAVPADASGYSAPIVPPLTAQPITHRAYLAPLRARVEQLGGTVMIRLVDVLGILGDCRHDDLTCPPGTCDWSGRDGRDG